jgi:hypothetical protein
MEILPPFSIVALFASSQFTIFEIIRMSHWDVTGAVLWEFAEETLKSTRQEEKMGKRQKGIRIMMDSSVIVTPRPHELRPAILREFAVDNHTNVAGITITGVDFDHFRPRRYIPGIREVATAMLIPESGVKDQKTTVVMRSRISHELAKL